MSASATSTMDGEVYDPGTISFLSPIKNIFHRTVKEDGEVIELKDKIPLLEDRTGEPTPSPDSSLQPDTDNGRFWKFCTFSCRTDEKAACEPTELTTETQIDGKQFSKKILIGLCITVFIGVIVFLIGHFSTGFIVSPECYDPKGNNCIQWKYFFHRSTKSRFYSYFTSAFIQSDVLSLCIAVGILLAFFSLNIGLDGLITVFLIVLSPFAGNLAHFCWDTCNPSTGASAIIWGLTSQTFFLLRKKYAQIPRYIIWVCCGVLAAYLIGMTIFQMINGDSISHAAHVGGGLFGLFFAWGRYIWEHWQAHTFRNIEYLWLIQLCIVVLLGFAFIGMIMVNIVEPYESCSNNNGSPNESPIPVYSI